LLPALSGLIAVEVEKLSFENFLDYLCCRFTGKTDRQSPVCGGY